MTLSAFAPSGFCRRSRRALLVAFAALSFLPFISSAADDPRAELARAEQLEKDKKYAEAVAAYTKLLEAHPYEAGLYSRRGWARHLAGDEAGALADLGTADVFDSDNINIIARRGWVNAAVKDWDAAIADFQACAKLEPAMARWHYEIAVCLHRSGKPAEALREIDQAISADPENMTFVVVRATVHEKLGNREEGLADCERALAALKSEKSIATVKVLQQRLTSLGQPGGSAPKAGALLPGGRPSRVGATLPEKPDGVPPRAVSVDVERDDTIEGDAVSLQAIDSSTPAVAPQSASVTPPPASATVAKPAASAPSTPPPTAARRDSAAAVPAASPTTGDARALEGVWKGKGIGTWTFQVLRDLGGGVVLVHSGDGGRGLVESLPQAGVWLFIQGDEHDAPGDCNFWRLEIRQGRLLTRKYEPHPSERWFDVGTFTTYVSAFVGPLAERETYDPAEDTDDGNRPVDWLKFYHDRIQARAGDVALLRRGGFEPAKETSRRREWAAAWARREVDDVIERMAAEEDKHEADVQREKAEGRALVRKLNEQFYYFGSEPPGFDNCADYDTLSLAINPTIEPSSSPDFAARRRREAIILWNLLQNLELNILREQRYQRGLHGMKPELRKQAIANLEESIAEQQKRLKELRAAMAKSEPGKWDYESAKRELPAIEEDIADSKNRIRCLEGEITRRASLSAPGGYEEIPFSSVLAEARRKVTGEFDLPACMRGIAARLDKELPATAGKAPPPSVPSGASAIPGDCQIELPDEMQGVPRS